MIDSEMFYNAATKLFTNIDQINISSTTYSDSALMILQFLKKKRRQNDLRNLKSLYKLWIDPKVSGILLIIVVDQKYIRSGTIYVFVFEKSQVHYIT